mmetsp:Transcript_8056/g.21056  ORF Transcript_8056/g.21056 Transcript_8056/m.21056 type:complete len:216 (-) Transcript_8056:287-934(-)
MFILVLISSNVLKTVMMCKRTNIRTLSMHTVSPDRRRSDAGLEDHPSSLETMPATARRPYTGLAAILAPKLPSPPCDHALLASTRRPRARAVHPLVCSFDSSSTTLCRLTHSSSSASQSSSAKFSSATMPGATTTPVSTGAQPDEPYPPRRSWWRGISASGWCLSTSSSQFSSSVSQRSTAGDGAPRGGEGACIGSSSPSSSARIIPSSHSPSSS